VVSPVPLVTDQSISAQPKIHIKRNDYSKVKRDVNKMHIQNGTSRNGRRTKQHKAQSGRRHITAHNVGNQLLIIAKIHEPEEGEGKKKSGEKMVHAVMAGTVDIISST
jgi:hypothetical protein